MTVRHVTPSKVKVKVTGHSELEIPLHVFSKSVSSAIQNVSWQMNCDS